MSHLSLSLALVSRSKRVHETALPYTLQRAHLKGSDIWRQRGRGMFTFISLCSLRMLMWHCHCYLVCLMNDDLCEFARLPVARWYIKVFSFRTVELLILTQSDTIMFDMNSYQDHEQQYDNHINIWFETVLLMYMYFIILQTVCLLGFWGLHWITDKWMAPSSATYKWKSFDFLQRSLDQMYLP